MQMTTEVFYYVYLGNIHNVSSFQLMETVWQIHPSVQILHELTLWCGFLQETVKVN